MVTMMLRDIIANAAKDGSDISIKLYSNPTSKWEKKHNKDMESLIHTFGSLTEDKPDNIDFCTCTDKTDRYIKFTFDSECVAYMDDKINQTKGE